MVGFDGMLTAPAEKAGIKVPPDLENYNPNEYPHWYVFSKVQLGTSMPNPTAHWQNAEIIAKIPQEDIFSVSVEDILGMGFLHGRSK